MNLTVGSVKASRTLKHLKALYISGACGIALAAAAAVAITPWQNASKPAGAGSSHPINFISHSQVRDDYTFYLVGSEAERDTLIARAAGDDFLAINTWIVIVQSLADEARIAGAQAELTARGHIAHVVDMRGR